MACFWLTYQEIWIDVFDGVANDRHQYSLRYACIQHGLVYHATFGIVGRAYGAQIGTGEILEEFY